MNASYIPKPLPEAMTKQEIGAHMAMLRAQFNLTQHEVSERLHIRTRYIAAIEEAAFERMPGKVYARGYIHTYAEFLGLNAEQVVTQCFAQEVAVAPTVAPTRMLVNHVSTVARHPWRGYMVMIVVALGVAWGMNQFFDRPEDVLNDENAVTPVPEDMLQTVRTAWMPTVDNFDCLMHDAALTCSYTDATSHEMTVLRHAQLRFLGDMDVSSLVVPEEGLDNVENISSDGAVPDSVEVGATVPGGVDE